MVTRCLLSKPASGVLVFLMVWALLFQYLQVPRVQAQTTGTIYGTVSDISGAAIVGATVTVKNTATNLTRSIITNAEGSYRFPLLPVGRYSITVAASGFKPYVRESLELQVEQNLRADFTLEVGEISEQVVVTTEAPQVDTATATLGKVVEEERIVDLPLNGRNFLELGVLQAGVAPPIPNIDVIGSGTNNTPGGTKFNFAVNGMRITSNNHLLDGANNVEPVSGAAMIVPSPDALQEFRILTNSYSAEFGRAGGSIVTVVTKSGTNSFHGSLYEFLRNDIFDARNFFAPDVPALKQNQFGATIGGPIRKDKTFFFGSYEGFRQRRGIPVTAPVPSLRVRQGDFSQEAIKPIDPLTGQPFPGGIIPQNRIDPVARNVLNLWPEPNLGDAVWTSAPSGANDRNQFVARIDHTLIEGRNTITGRYIFDDGSILIPLGHFASNAAPFIQVPGFSNEEASRFQNFMIADTHTFSERVINDFRFSYQRANVASGKPVNQVDPSTLGFTFPKVSSIDVAPVIAVAGVSGLGPPIFSQRVNNFYQFVDSVAVNSGRHTIKFGGEVRHTRLTSLFTSIANGSFFFNGLATGNPLGDLLIGAPFLFLQAAGKEDKSLKQTVAYFYVQDDFRLRRNLTLNLGLRYELSPGFTEKDNLLLTFVPGRQSQLSPTLPTGLLHSGDPGIPETIFPTEKDNFAPRIGIAWDPFGDGKTSVRAGYGVFYDESGLIQTYNVYQAPDFQPIAVLIFPPSFADPFLGNSPFKPPLSFPVPVGPGTTATWVAPDLKHGFIQHWNLTLQRQITSSMAVEVAYVGNRGTRLQGNVDVNQPVFTKDSTPLNITQRRPFPLLSSTFQVTSIFNSSYHGLQTTLTRRLSNGLTFQAAYTWSKAIDDTTTPSAFFLIPGQNAGRAQDNRRLDLERALSAFDLRHRFVLSYIYDLPFFRQSTGAASALLGGWRLNGIVSLQSGHPFTVGDSLDPNLDAVNENDRPNLVGDPNLPADQRTPERWFNTAAFQRFTPAQAPVMGTAGRNIVFSDGIVNFDMGLAKEFRLGEQPRLEFRWEVFNVFNHPNFGVPENDLNSPSFGRVFRTSTPERIMQFALKFLF
ncbi:MAG TPA: carboxypeptidase regulatory-like domain-containing protein [Blastocatellia bacterium]|nr:carboxypeptidase regulatory-like domain-containing protein [Blastocatellia bacterium]